MNKKELRKRILEQRGALSPKERHDKSMCIAQQVIGLECFKKCNKVLLYMSVRSEVETKEIYLAAQRLGKKIYYPRVNGQQMEFYRVDYPAEFEIGAYGIREPKAEEAKRFVPKEKDEILVIVPGVAFDAEGNRIGYGGGYYDKYLQRLTVGNSQKNICKVAVAYDCQIVEIGTIESETHDIRVDYIITETRDIRRER